MRSRKFTVLKPETKELNCFGEPREAFAPSFAVQGWLDLSMGTDVDRSQNAVLAESSHVLITDGMAPKISEADRIQDEAGRMYEVLYADNVMGVDDHLELYLKVIL